MGFRILQPSVASAGRQRCQRLAQRAVRPLATPSAFAAGGSLLNPAALTWPGPSLLLVFCRSPSRALSGKRTLECGSAGEGAPAVLHVGAPKGALVALTPTIVLLAVAGTARKHARTTGASLFSSAAAASAALSTCTAGLTPIRTSCSIDSSVSAALSFGGTLAAQAAEDVVAMLAGTSNESAAAAAAALPTAAGCSSMEPQQEELEEEPCTPRWDMSLGTCMGLHGGSTRGINERWMGGALPWRGECLNNARMKGRKLIHCSHAA